MSTKLAVSSVIALNMLLLSFAPSAEAQPAAPQSAVPQATGPELADDERLPEPEVLSQGPLHEAFAKPLSLEPNSLIVDLAPPEPINELPPEERPEGNNVNWLPGYWSYDIERQDFVWVSGLWRDFPPGRTWVPGEWQQVEEGFRWVAGFWADADVQEKRFLPIPPANLEQGPSSPAPGDNYLWNPGCWQWTGNDYAWQPGSWYVAQPDWVWVPNHYCYTPRGSIYVGGYWDYPLARRGLIYAPVYWGSGYRFATGYAYRPTTLVNTGLLIANLFIDRNYGRYYYGNHWGHGQQVPYWLSPWNNRAFGQWGRYHGNANIYDPMFAHYRWAGHRQGSYGNYAGRDFQNRGRNSGEDLLRKVNRLSGAEREALKLHRNNADELARFSKNAKKYQDFGRDRAKGDQRSDKATARNDSLRIPQIEGNGRNDGTKRVDSGKLAREGNEGRNNRVVNDRTRGNVEARDRNRQGRDIAISGERGANARDAQNPLRSSPRSRFNGEGTANSSPQNQPELRSRENRGADDNVELQRRDRVRGSAQPNAELQRGNVESRQRGLPDGGGQVVNPQQSGDAYRRMLDAQRSRGSFGPRGGSNTASPRGDALPGGNRSVRINSPGANPSARNNFPGGNPGARNSFPGGNPNVRNNLPGGNPGVRNNTQIPFNRRVTKPVVPNQGGARFDSSRATQGGRDFRGQNSPGQLQRRVQQSAPQFRGRGNSENARGGKDRR